MRRIEVFMKKVKDVMFKDVMTVSRSTTLPEILIKFREFHTFSLIPVIEDGKLIGLISIENLMDLLRPKEPDILKTIPFLDEQPIEIDDMLLAPEMGHLIVAEDIMHSKILTVEENMSLDKTLNIMQLNRQNHLAVVDEHHNFLGVISIFDVVIRTSTEQGIL
jgi:CBS domain-containing protein